jgi:hypothetical protein
VDWAFHAGYDKNLNHLWISVMIRELYWWPAAPILRTNRSIVLLDGKGPRIAADGLFLCSTGIDM